MEDTAFEADDDVLRIAEAYAGEAIEFARRHFAVQLDWSDASVQHVETILTRFHDEMARARPSEDQVVHIARMFGSYIGEVFRRNHGARWGLVTMDGGTFPGLEAANGGGIFWPWGRAQNRVVNGAGDNVWHYFRQLTAKAR